MSGVFTALTAWYAYRIAEHQGVRLAALVPVLLWMQPLTLTLSYTTLTETPLAFYLTLAMWLYLRRRFAASCAVISLAAITRHEAALFPLLWAITLIARRRPVREWIWVAWAAVIHNLLTWLLLSTPAFLLFLEVKPTDEYGTGSWLSMFVRWVMAAGIGPLVLACMGAGAAWRLPGGRLWIGAGLAYFVTHTVIFRFGLFASGGYPRFLVPIGPVLAVAAAVALSEAWGALESARKRRGRVALQRESLWLGLVVLTALWLGAEMEIAKLRDSVVAYGFGWALTAARVFAGGLVAVAAAALMMSAMPGRLARVSAVTLVPGIMVVLTVGQPLVVATLPPPIGHCGRLRLSPRLEAHKDALVWLEARDLLGRRWVAASPWFDEFRGAVRPPDAPIAGTLVEDMQPGELLLWDCRHFTSPRHGYPRERMLGRDDFGLLWSSDGDAWDGVYCEVFEKRRRASAGD
jgi:hypothetical protein